MQRFRFEPPPGLVLAVGAHPDDIEIGAAATILVIADQFPEAAFRFLVASSEDERRSEAEASARALLADRVDISVGQFRDGFLPYADPAGVKSWLREEAAGSDPDLVFAPHRADRHQDHRFVAEIAAQLFRSQPIFGYEIAKYDGDTFLPNVYSPLPALVATHKLAHLLKAFPSQLEKPWFTQESLEATMRLRGIECRAESGRAEAFISRGIVLT